MRHLAFALSTLWAVSLPGLACEPPIELIIQTSYLSGTLEVLGPDGHSLGKSEVLIKRTQNPRQQQIEEEILQVDSHPHQPVKHFMLHLSVDPNAGTFELEERNGAFKGSGTLLGRPWRWSRWTSTSILPDGSRVESEDVLEGEGLIANKKLFSPDGHLQFLFRETLQHTPSPAFQQRWHELLSQ